MPGFGIYKQTHAGVTRFARNRLRALPHPATDSEDSGFGSKHVSTAYKHARRYLDPTTQVSITTDART